MTRDDVDILLITYRRPGYAKLSIESLLSQADERTRVWLWHNGDDEETLALTKSYADHPRVHRFHHSPENLRLVGPTNWLWENAEGALLSKIDDDCVLEDGWIDRLRKIHRDNPKVGVCGAWRFQPEDYDENLSRPKLRDVEGGDRMLVNAWVQGSGYLMKRECIEQQGLLPVENPDFTKYCMNLAEAGWLNGFAFPFVYEDHMDDPRSPNTLLKSDADLKDHVPLGVIKDGVRTIDDWLERVKWNAYMVQTAPANPLWLRGWRLRLRMLGSKAKMLVGAEKDWGANPKFKPRVRR